MMTLPQAKFIELIARQILWRAANQVGKSRGLARKIESFIEGVGPYADLARRGGPGPKKVLVISESKEQMEPLHEKLWMLLPKDRIDLETTEYIPGFGFRGKPPRITWTAGPGKGSVIVFATYAQGSRRVAGGTFDVVACDEPLPEKIYGEALMRCMHGSPGELWMTFTATPESPPLAYLRKKVESGEIVELHTPLTVDAMRLVDSAACLWKGKRAHPDEVRRHIGEFSRIMLALERDMRLNGGWEIVVQDRILDNWGPHCVRDLRPWPDAWLSVGIDHGTGAGRQTAALVQMDLAQPEWPRVGLLAESRSEGFTTPEMDARAIWDMIGRKGLSWRDVDAWWGDRATNVNKSGVRKFNAELHAQLAKLAGVPSEHFPRLNVPNKAGGSVNYGYRLMNACMGRRDVQEGDIEIASGPARFLVDPACVHFIEAARRHNGRNPKDPLKDILDAVRYPTEEGVQPKLFAGLALLG